MELKEKIEKQLAAGFAGDEIYNNLLKDGHTKEEIDSVFTPALVAQSNSNSGGGQVSGKGIALGILFFIIVIFRIVRFSNSTGNTAVFAFISIITGIGLMIFWFTRKKR